MCLELADEPGVVEVACHQLVRESRRHGLDGMVKYRHDSGGSC